MSCCGQRRQAYRAAPPATPLPPAPPRRDHATVAVGHLADYPIVVGGAVSGAAYVFGPRGPTLKVDERDVAALLATGRFERR